jgi:shikimate dehydrogenase
VVAFPFYAVVLFRSMSEHVDILGVAGRPILHSLSPVLFREFFRQTGAKAAYTRLAASSAAEALSLFRALDLRGLNLTAPFKEEAAKLVDELSPDAAALGAVNSVVLGAEGRLVGHNTDPAGVSGALSSRGFSPAGKRCLVIGSGGAGKAAARALVSAGARVTVANRTRERAEELASRFGCEAAGLDRLSELARASDLIISTLASSNLPDPESWFPREGRPFVLDADYKTARLASYASSRGLPTAGGGDWLIGQALPAYELFMGASLSDRTGASFPALASVLALSKRAYARDRKIALIGLMGAGKSSSGRLLASLLGLPFVDSDKEIEAEARMTIPQIFASEGESGFRSRESRIIDRITSTQGPLVLSAGGGAATVSANAAMLAERCLTAWLYVSPATAAERSGASRGAGAAAAAAARPLLAVGDPEQKLVALEAERRGAYASASELVISTEGRGAGEVAQELYEEIDRLS